MSRRPPRSFGYVVCGTEPVRSGAGPLLMSYLELLHDLLRNDRIAVSHVDHFPVRMPKNLKRCRKMIVIKVILTADQFRNEELWTISIRSPVLMGLR